MMKPKRIALLLILGLALLSGCRQPINNKTELKTNTTEIITLLKSQRTQLESINTAYEKLQQQLPQAQKKSPNTNLLTDKNSRVYQLNQTATTSYQTSQDNLKKLASINTRLKDTAAQKVSNLPNSAILKLNQSLHIIQLDHESLEKFMEAYQKDQTELFKSAPDLINDDSDELNVLISQSNQYLGAVSQELEIYQVNLNSSLSRAEELLTALK